MSLRQGNNIIAGSPDEHRVVEFQEPTAANDYTWYRLYADGWVEQGGCYDNGSAVTDFSVTITLPVEMRDARYSVAAIASRNTGAAANRAGFTNVYTQTTTQIGVGWYHSSSTSNEPMRYMNWQVSGMAAN